MIKIHLADISSYYNVIANITKILYDSLAAKLQLRKLCLNIKET